MNGVHGFVELTELDKKEPIMIRVDSIDFIRRCIDKKLGPYTELRGSNFIAHVSEDYQEVVDKCFKKVEMRFCGGLV